MRRARSSVYTRCRAGRAAGTAHGGDGCIPRSIGQHCRPARPDPTASRRSAWTTYVDRVTAASSPGTTTVTTCCYGPEAVCLSVVGCRRLAAWLAAAAAAASVGITPDINDSYREARVVRARRLFDRTDGSWHLSDRHSDGEVAQRIVSYVLVCVCVVHLLRLRCRAFLNETWCLCVIVSSRGGVG